MNRTMTRLCGLVLSVIVSSAAVLYAAPLTKESVQPIKLYFLNGNIQKAIFEGEKLMESADYSAASEELYYILGLCYLKDGNYLRASDIFEIVLKEFKDGAYSDQARLGLADSYLMAEEYDRAEALYKELLENDKLQPVVYHRLSSLYVKKGNTTEAEEYQSKLKQRFPDAMELIDKSELEVLKDKPAATSSYYTIQVGSFTKSKNADGLCAKLKAKGFDAYIQEIKAEERPMYRVKVGKFKSKEEASRVRERLMNQGYPTKLSP